LITSITRHCSGDVAEQAGMEACLWVLVHMGSRVAHVMALIVEAANARFEALPASRQSELLRVVLEVGARTKVRACGVRGGRGGDEAPCSLTTNPSPPPLPPLPSKAHAVDLARLVDILPDDIRNFLQRWIIEKVGVG
jgi:hypothetical protein